MKKLVLLFCFIFNALAVSAGFLSGAFFRTYYPTHSIGFNGSISVYNDGGTTAQFGDPFTFGTAAPAKFIKTLPSGDDLYRNTSQYGTIEYVISPDRSKMAQIVSMYGDWTMTTWYVDSKEEQLAFYDANKYYQSEGITFDYSWEDSSGDSHSSKPKRNSSCSKCGGSGIDPSPSQIYGTASWLAEYNSKGNKCRICGKYSEHYHVRCSSCNTPRH
ncbi:MAG: hypothetical protein K2N05_01710 [Muribaculaceae bacterium]|nr:hypothetical protein [Muribaculaceae bacterium]